MNRRRIYFLGVSGAGKSTLINALVADGKSVVPAGGIGPCTVQAIVVRYGGRASFRAEYHSEEKVLQLLVGLANIYGQHAEISHRTKSALREIVSKDLLNQIEKSTLWNKKEQKTTRHEYLKQANLMITGQQETQKEITYLIDGLFVIMYEKVLFKSRLERKDIERIATIRVLLEKGLLECCDNGRCKYGLSLNEHATGYLAPIIRTFDVRVKSDLLKAGLEFVDLPGVGIDGDIHKNVASENIAKADAIVLVVSTRGIGVAEHKIMKAAGIYDRLFSAVDKRDKPPIFLTIAVTRVDDIACSRFRHNKHRKKWQHLIDVCTETENNMRTQLQSLLKKEYGLSGKTDAMTGFIDRISQSVKIVPITAVESRKFHINDPEDRPFITDESQSNIPILREILTGL